MLLIRSQPLDSPTPRRHQALALVLLAALGLQGCAAAVVGGAAVGATAVAQERSVGSAVDDVTLHTDLNGRLLRESSTLFRRVQINVVEGRVLMTGAVPNDDDRVTAERVAWNTPGTNAVLNEIKVREPTSIWDDTKDTWITSQLRTALLADKEIRSINYKTEAIDGVVYIIGIAGDAAEKAAVIDHARDISGVRDVVDHIILKDDPRRKRGG